MIGVIPILRIKKLRQNWAGHNWEEIAVTSIAKQEYPGYTESTQKSVRKRQTPRREKEGNGHGRRCHTRNTKLKIHRVGEEIRKWAPIHYWYDYKLLKLF